MFVYLKERVRQSLPGDPSQCQELVRCGSLPPSSFKMKKGAPLFPGRRAHHLGTLRARLLFGMENPGLGRQHARPCSCSDSMLFYRQVSRAERWFKHCSGREWEAEAPWGRWYMLHTRNNGSPRGKACLVAKAGSYDTNPHHG